MGNNVSLGDSIPATEFIHQGTLQARDYEDSISRDDNYLTQSMFILPTSKLSLERSISRKTHSRSRSASEISSLSTSLNMKHQSQRKTIRRVKPARILAIEQELKRAEVTEQLLAAAARGDAETVSQLLSQGADVDAHDGDNMTALHYAAMHARPNVIDVLVENGADVDAYDTKGGFTPLHWAVINSQAFTTDTQRVDDTILALARGGCDPNSRDFNHATPLHFAARTDNHLAVETLMRLGADPNAKNIQGWSCAKVANSAATKILIIKMADKKARAVYHVLQIPEIPVF